MHPAQARHLVDRAIKTALSEKGVATIIFPEDVTEEDAEPSPPRERGAVYSSIGWSKTRILPHDGDLKRAADVLNAGERVAMLVGQGAAGARDEGIDAA